MQGHKDYIAKLMYQINLEDLVPRDNFYRQLDAALDLHFLYKATEQFYGVKTRSRSIRGCFSRFVWLVI
jgi:hypothetical protein